MIWSRHGLPRFYPRCCSGAVLETKSGVPGVVEVVVMGQIKNIGHPLPSSVLQWVPVYPGRHSNWLCSCRRGRQVQEGGAIVQGSGLSLDEGQVMVPVIDRFAVELVRLLDQPLVFAQDLPFRSEDKEIGKSRGGLV